VLQVLAHIEEGLSLSRFGEAPVVQELVDQRGLPQPLKKSWGR